MDAIEVFGLVAAIVSVVIGVTATIATSSMTKDRHND